MTLTQTTRLRDLGQIPGQTQQCQEPIQPEIEPLSEEETTEYSANKAAQRPRAFTCDTFGTPSVYYPAPCAGVAPVTVPIVPGAVGGI